MTEPVVIDVFAGGMNNMSPVDRLPEGQVRDLLNLDPVGGGALQLRAGRDKCADLGSVHGAVPYGDGFLLAAGEDLIRFSAATNEARVIGQVAASGGLCGAELNGDAFLCSAVSAMRVRGDQVGAWGLPEIYPRVTVGVGTMPAGIYRVAVTAMDAFSAESGAAPLVVTLTEPGSIELLWVAPAGAASCRVYASVANGETLYLQADGVTGGHTIESVRDDSARLMTGNLVPPPVAAQIVAYKSRLLLVAGSAVWITEPFAPHLVNMAHGFVHYGAAVDMIAATDGGVFIAAGQKTYFLTNPGMPESAQPTVLEFGAVRGSGVTLPDGRAAWMTRYGQAFGAPDGSVQLPQREKYSPQIASGASVGVVDGNGVQMLVTTMKGPTRDSVIGVADSFDLEIEYANS